MGSKIVHFEIPVIDTEKMSRFYSELFGWKFAKAPMEGMDYWLISTDEGTGALGGGMYKKMHESDKPRFYMQVDDIDGHTERFKQAGGVVIMEKQEVPGTGYTVIGVDPEGNAIGLFQPFQSSTTQQSSTTSSTPQRQKKSSSSNKKATQKSKQKKRKGRAK